MPTAIKKRVEELFRAALSRRPTDDESARYETFLGDGGADRLEDAYWTLLNTREFITRH